MKKIMDSIKKFFKKIRGSFKVLALVFVIAISFGAFAYNIKPVTAYAKARTLPGPVVAVKFTTRESINGVALYDYETKILTYTPSIYLNNCQSIVSQNTTTPGNNYVFNLVIKENKNSKNCNTFKFVEPKYEVKGVEMTAKKWRNISKNIYVTVVS